MTSTARILTAHPRSRGEHTPEELLEGVVEGSSPLTRGARLASLPAWFVPRLIPAHAGSTMNPVRKSVKNRAHPRSRGEHWLES